MEFLYLKMMKFDDMLSSGERREPVGARGIHIPQKKWRASWSYDLSFPVT